MRILAVAWLIAASIAATPAYGAGTAIDRWSLLTDPAEQWTSATLPSAGWRPVRAGVSWNAQFDDLRDYFGVAWYRAQVDVPASRAATRVVLRFGAVDYAAEVFVNGTSVGTHEGAYTPFAFDVTDRVKPGPNTVLVRVVDPPPTVASKPRYPDMPYEELPRGKQNWYIQNGGLWQPVLLDLRPALYIEAVRVTPKTTGATAIEVELRGTPQPRAMLTVRVRDTAGAVVAALPVTAVAGPGTTRLSAQIASPALWSPETPVLYTVDAALSGAVSDRVEDRFGIREFTARDGQFFLNGEPFYMIGALDQDFYPETIYSTPGRPYLVDMMKKGRALGLNLLRCHIKVCDPDYLAAADEVGMLVWYEVPSWDTWTDRAVARGRDTLVAMTTRDWNHPSIVIQSLINEAWGIDMKQPAQRAGLARWFTDAKALLAPLGRLVVDNSPCCENFHIQTDIDDYHQYYSIPDNAARWDAWVKDFASRPKWSFSPHGDAARTGNEPLVVSEFGNWGLPVLPQELPWWFPRDFDGRAITRPAGLFDRFHGLGFDRVFRDYPSLAMETQWRQFFSLKHEIEAMRRHQALRGYVITEFTDINWEANGLMDMWRRPKIYAEALSDIQQADVLLPESPARVVRSGAPVEVAVSLSRYSAADPAGSVLAWRTTSGASGDIPVTATVPRAGVGPIAHIPVKAPAVSAATLERVSFELRGKDGRVLARNFHDLFVYPAPGAPPAGIEVHDSHAAHGYLPWKRSPLTPGSTVVAGALDAGLRGHLERGGAAVVLLSKVVGALTAAPGLAVAERRGDLDGNWVTNFPWIHLESPAFRGVGLTRITGFEAAAATPRALIAGVAAPAWQDGDVLSGVFFGWLNESRATTVQYKVGKGRVILTTLDFSAYGTDPFATELLHALVDYANSDKCAPVTSLPH